VLGPLERFLHVEASSGIVLLIAAAVALVWANSGWHAAYEALWHTPIHLGAGEWVFKKSLHFWINDGLMAVFFFVVGLEIRREIHEGELADFKRAALPIAAALGGMVVPATIYLVANPSAPSSQGWGVPTATDIAFAVGVLALLGKRVPPALRVLLLALAIIDDIGAILVIALFYSSGIAWTGLVVALLGIGAVLVLQRLGARRDLLYVLPAIIVWLGILDMGVHPTIAGVLLGVVTPVRSWFGPKGFLSVASDSIEEFRHHSEREEHDVDALVAPLKRIKEAYREALPPVVRVQSALHPWVAFGIMPLFALANAGVDLRGVSLDEPASRAVAFGVMAGLVVGKPLGILLASYACVRAGICVLPRGVTLRGMMLVGAVAGIGFTMAIFIAGLAFAESPSLLAAAKLAVLLASALAAVAALTIGRLLLPAQPSLDAAATLEQAEGSAEV
jgi:NhaA family Na+:H+ antiporter